jgi:hypothetical protein
LCCNKKLTLFCAGLQDSFSTVTSLFAGTLDHALWKGLSIKSCKWLSFSKSDNLYGLEVVNRVLAATLPLAAAISSGVAVAVGSSVKSLQPDMVLVPTDSKFFADQGR